MGTTLYRTVFGLLLFIGILLQWCDANVHCRDENGNNVDWYVMYKKPNINGAGLTYLYMDPHTNGWQPSTRQINGPTGALAHTLRPLLNSYANLPNGFAYVLYNDQPPYAPTAADTFGHSKGLVMLEGNTGIWLSHSIPQFPMYRIANNNGLLNNANVNGQTLMCVTYPINQFREIGLQLKYIHVYSYDTQGNLPLELQCVAARTCRPTAAPWFRTAVLTSLGGQVFTSYAKYSRFGGDLYSDLLSNIVNRNMFAKSWGGMRQPLPPHCNGNNEVLNVEEVHLPTSEVFSITRDHSKWCVATDGSWACITDTNREVSQQRRGGGAICMTDRTFGTNFEILVGRSDRC